MVHISRLASAASTWHWQVVIGPVVALCVHSPDDSTSPAASHLLTVLRLRKNIAPYLSRETAIRGGQ